MNRTGISLAAAAFLAACQTPSGPPAGGALLPALEAVMPIASAETATGVPHPQGGEDLGPAAVLYGRDGQPVRSGARTAGAAAALQGAAQAPARAPGEPTHDLRTTETGRMHILELYQKVIEERDALALEATALGRQLERERARAAELESRGADLDRRLAALEEERKKLQDESFDLAARLTMAQIRRLQAEKLLLEHKLEQRRKAEAAAVAPKEGP